MLQEEEAAVEQKRNAAKATGKGEGLGGNQASVVKEFEFFSGLEFCSPRAAAAACVCVGAGAAASDGGPTGTPLPDKKLLLFILDRLQK
jgi:bromodomain-containing protein 7/9